jgi:hypothetical protein
MGLTAETSLYRPARRGGIGATLHVTALNQADAGTEADNRFNEAPASGSQSSGITHSRRVEALKPSLCEDRAGQAGVNTALISSLSSLHYRQCNEDSMTGDMH